MSKDNHTGRNVALGALIAGVAGYVAGVLTAPKSGKETREDLKNAAVSTRDEAAAKIAALKSELDQLSILAKERAGSLNAKAKAELNDALKKAKEAQAKASTVLKAVKSGKAKDPDLNLALQEAKNARDHLKSFLKK